MSRPDFPNPYCILTSNCISRIISNQNEYDKDPEAWGRIEKENCSVDEIVDESVV